MVDYRKQKIIIMEVFRILVVVMGVSMSFAYYPQAYKIWKNKSAENISIFAYVIFSLGTLTWFLYGIAIQDMIIAISFVIGVFGSWAVLILAFIYKKV